MRDRTPEDIMRSNECNTYVMSCHINRDDLYIAMREDISTMCYAYSIIKAQRDELLEAAKAYQKLSICYRTDKLVSGKLFMQLEKAKAAIANAEMEEKK